MALFKGRDARLPLLTQVAQLNFVPSREEPAEKAVSIDELDRFICQYVNAISSRPVEEDRWTQTQEAKSRRHTKGATAEEQLEQLAVQLFSVVEILWAKVQEDVAPDEDIEQANAFLAQRWPTPRLFVEKNPTPGKFSKPQPTLREMLRRDAQLTLVMFPEKSDADFSMLDWVAALIARDLVDVFNHPENLGICSVCSSPFVRNKGDQMYCSYRCAARIGQRRRRGNTEAAGTAPKAAEVVTDVGLAAPASTH